MGCKETNQTKKQSKYLGFGEANLTLVLLNPDVSSLENYVDPDQLASDEASWSGSAMFSIQPQNPLY